MPTSEDLDMPTPEDRNMGLYHPDLDHISVPQNKEEIADHPEIWLSAVRLMQANITQARLQFEAMHQQVSTWERNDTKQKSEIAIIRGENNDLMAKNTKANLLIANLQSQLTVATSTTQSLTEKRHLSEKLPDPELYDGDKQKLRSWIYSLNVKLVGNADRYPTESDKIRYLVGRLTGKALNQVEPRVKENGSPDFDTVRDLIKYLELAFGDPDERGTAQRELHKLRQTNRPFSEYLADFRRIADRTEYDEEAKRAALLSGLSNEIQTALITVDLSRSLEETVATLQKIDNKIRALSARIPRTQTQTSAPTFASTNSGSRPKPVQSTSSPVAVFAHPTGATSAANPALPGGDAMDLGVGRARGPLTPAERARRINNNLCMYCGDVNHYAGNCPKANRKTLLRGMVINNEKATTVKPAALLETISPADSENL